MQVFTPYQGKIMNLFAKIGDEVKKGETLFTIDSPDLLAAKSTLIAAAGVLDLTSRNLVRLKKLYRSRAIAQKDMEQAVSDQQTAEGALRAARDAVRIFGKTEDEIDQDRRRNVRVDPILVVPSPIDGRITARNAAPGLFVQPGNPPAPYSVADISTMWMLANVAESDSPAFHVGQEVKVTVMPPIRAACSTERSPRSDATVDPNTHRLSGALRDRRSQARIATGHVRELRDPHRRSGALARGAVDGVVREGDGTMTVWVTSDRHRFTKRTVKIGLQHDGFRPDPRRLEAGRTGRDARARCS